MRSFFPLTTLITGLCISPQSHAQFPFVVRTIYFQPNGAPDAPVEIDRYMKGTQDFYKKEMLRHGYDPKTFRLETRNGKVVVNVVKGRGEAWEYTNQTSQKVNAELPQQFKNQNNIHVIFIGGLANVDGHWGVGSPIYGRACGGYAVIATMGEAFRMPVVAHELGHTFGLYHDLENPLALMGSGDDELNDFECRWLDKHHYFNNVHAINAVPEVIRVHKPKVVKLDKKEYIEFNIEARSTNQLHQAQLLRVFDVGVIGWSELQGNKDIAKIFVRRSWLVEVNTIIIQILDVQGNHFQHTIAFTLPRIPTEPIEEHSGYKEKT